MRQSQNDCMDNDKLNLQTRHKAILPASACLPINRCNLPALILGSPSFQQHPVPLYIDGVHSLHRSLFAHLDAVEGVTERVEYFRGYMDTCFQLNALEEAGHQAHSRMDRSRANYLRLLRGWGFDSNSREAAVVKGWVESRFGLIPRFHHEAITHPEQPSYRFYEQERAHGLYNTNALEAQLDLLYSYCQYELGRRFPQQSHLSLYRGINGLNTYEVLEGSSRQRQALILLNNMNSFTDSLERADEFGDEVLEVEVPLPKVFYFTPLLPRTLRGEGEYMVIGGVYRVNLERHLPV